MLGPGAAAQDANYWSIQYGPVAQLVGGQVIASSRDLSATYYNPGALSLGQEGKFLLSTESFQYEYISAEPQEGLEALDLSSSRFGTAPSLVAGKLPRWLGQRTSLAWSFLTRQELKARVGRRDIAPFDERGGLFVTESFLDQSVSEHWAGLTASVPVSDNLGVGATLYGVYRGQRSRVELSADAVNDAGSGLSVSGVQDFSYYHTRLLAKLGVAYEVRRVKLGLSVTTPGAGLFGSGDTGFKLSLFGVDADGNGVPDPPVVEAGVFENLPADYRSSWAIGGGASWTQGATQIHVSAEWFAPVDRFTVLQVTDDGGGESQTLGQELAGVFNAGIGYEHNFDTGVALYGAFRTDLSASVGDPRANASVSGWDVYHLSAGVAFSVSSTRFTLGATGSFGSNTRPIAGPVPPEEVPGAGLDTPLDTRYRRVVFLLGFLFGS